MTDNDASRSPRRGRSILWWVLGGLIAVVVVGYGAIFIYAKVLNDAPDALDESDLGAALSDSSHGASAGASDFDGKWKATRASEFGYRVQEVLAGVNSTAAGRGNDISGFLRIEGTSVIEVDVAVKVNSIKSNEPRRDTHFRDWIMNTDEFPKATFVLTEPIELGALPMGDEPVRTTATGELTLRGVTRTVTFDVTAQATAGRIGVLGSIPVVFKDYGIRNPSMPGVNTEDHGELEFVLVFGR